MRRRFETFDDEDLFMMQDVYMIVVFEGEYRAGYRKSNHCCFGEWDDSIDPRGNFVLNLDVIKNIRTIEDFLTAFDNRRIYSLYETPFVNAEKGIHELYISASADFEVDPDESWYAFSDGTGLPGTLANVYMELYRKEIIPRIVFHEELKMLLEYGNPVKIIFGIEGDDYDFENKVEYEIDLTTGNIKDTTEREEEEIIKYDPGSDYETARPENE